MSPRDTYWFIAGAASGLMVGALSVYFLVSSSTAGTAMPTKDAVTQTNTKSDQATSDPDVLMPGDRWPTQADVDSTRSAGTRGASTEAGSLETVTRSLAERLETKGGTDDEWRLLAQSYEYMGRTNEARAARMHEGSHPAGGGNTDGSRISGTVQIDAKLASLATPGATLFVYAMDPTAAGPPLAVLRLRVEHWPVSFTLDDADAMIPGRNLSAAKSIQLEARISTTGEALPQPGDLVGTVASVDPHTQQPINISIDHKIS